MDIVRIKLCQGTFATPPKKTTIPVLFAMKMACACAWVDGFAEMTLSAPLPSVKVLLLLQLDFHLSC